MLKFFRHKGVQKKIYIGLAVVVVCTFVLSGVIISGDKDRALTALGQFENHRFKVTDFLNSYRAVQRQAGFMYGDKLAEMRSRINFKGEAWDRILLLEYAKKQNIRATDQAVVDWIAKQEGFKKDGKFDRSFYEMYVERGMRTTPREFEEEIRQMLTIGLIQDKIKADLELTDEKLKQIYLEEKVEKEIIYGLLDWEKVASEVPVTDKDIQQVYDMVKDKLTAPARSKLQYIFVPKESETEMKALLDDKTSTFDQLAEKYKAQIKETGFFSKNEAVAELTDAPNALAFAFSASKSDVSEWQETPKGRYRLRLADTQAEHPMSLDEAKEEVTKKFKQQEATKLAVKRLQEIKDKMKASDDFEAYLKENNVETTKMEKYRKGMFPAGIWPSENLQNAVAKLKDNEISGAFEVPKGGMIVKVLKTLGADDSKFEEEKKTFREQTESKRSQEELEKLLTTLRDKLSINLEMMKELFPGEDASPATA